MWRPLACLGERDRLAATDQYDPSAPFDDEPYDAALELARDLFDVPMAFVSLLERDRQVIAMRRGLNLCETTRRVSFCAHAVARGEILVVPDATLDPRFADNPLVLGPPFFRFYAGAPLTSPTGHVVGTLCLADTRPREGFGDDARRRLGKLADLVRDRMEMRRLQVALRAGRGRFEAVATTSPDGIVCADADNRIVFWNAAAERLLGYSAAEAIGRPIDLVVPDRTLRSYGGLRRAAQEAELHLSDATVAFAVLGKDGRELPVELTLSTWRDGTEASIGAILHDARSRLWSQAELHRLAHQDPVTDLPNQAVLRRRIERLAGVAPAALLVLDLVGLNTVNDECGHDTGDAVLRAVARRLLAGTRAADTAVRLGGDRFAVLLAGVASPDGAADVARALLASLGREVVADGRRFCIGACAGVALHPADGATAAELTASAELALGQAKRDRDGRVHLFTPALRRAADRARHDDDELRAAFRDGEFELFYQPQIRVADERLVGAEALLRWHHGHHGLLAPAAFLSALERSPVAAEVGRWILVTACKQAAGWRRRHDGAFRIGVNLFGSQFGTGDLDAAVTETLASTGLPPDALELEITETTALRRDRNLVEPLERLRAAGVGIAFDDYGTGYASLSTLRRLPVTRLKVDKGFVANMCTDPADAAIVRSVVYLGRALDLAVIAEGVETRQQLDGLRDSGCTEVQGFLFGAPMPAAEFAALFDRAPVGVRAM